jgi:hypothetical protein
MVDVTLSPLLCPHYDHNRIRARDGGDVVCGAEGRDILDPVYFSPLERCTVNPVNKRLGQGHRAPNREGVRTHENPLFFSRLVAHKNSNYY